MIFRITKVYLRHSIFVSLLKSKQQNLVSFYPMNTFQLLFVNYSFYRETHTSTHRHKHAHRHRHLHAEKENDEGRGGQRDRERQMGFKASLVKKNYIFHLSVLFSFFSKAYFCRSVAEYQGKIKPEKYWVGQKVHLVNE